MKRIMVFIDGNNFESAVGKEIRLDYPKLARTVAARRGGIFQRLYFYTAMAKKNPAYIKQVEQAQRFIHALQTRDQVIVRVGNLISIGKDAEGRDILTEKGTDVQLAIDLLALPLQTPMTKRFFYQPIPIISPRSNGYDNLVRTLQFYTSARDRCIQRTARRKWYEEDHNCFFINWIILCD